MTLSMTAAVNAIATLVRDTDGIAAAYSAGEMNQNAIPQALNGPFPCALVFPGQDTSPYILVQGQHRHTYEVTVQVFMSNQDMGSRMVALAPLTDALLEQFIGHVQLGGAVNSCLYRRQSGLVRLEYGGNEYTGVEITLEVSEQATALPASGD